MHGLHGLKGVLILEGGVGVTQPLRILDSSRNRSTCTAELLFVIVSPAIQFAAHK